MIAFDNQRKEKKNNYLKTQPKSLEREIQFNPIYFL